MARGFDVLTETLAKAFLGTFLGAVIAFTLLLLGDKNINWILWLRHGARRSHDIIRVFETLILEMIFIWAFVWHSSDCGQRDRHLFQADIGAASENIAQAR